MAGDNDQQVFIIDGELIERMLRGDTATDPSQQQRPVSSGGLASALALASGGRVEDALQTLQNAAQQGESPVEVQLGLGHLLFEQQKWTEAEAHYVAVAKLDPVNLTAHYNLAVCRERQSKFETAAQAFETVLSIDPKRWHAQWGRGRCRLRLGQPEKALTCFDLALKDFRGLGKESNPDRILSGKAVALHQIGRLDEAADLYSKLLQADPNSVDLLCNLVSVSAARKDETRVKEFADRLLKLQPESPAALEGLASIALSRGDYSAAVQHCLRLVKAARNSFEGWFNLGVAYHQLSQLEQAVNSYREAALLRPGSVEANANLGAALQECGDLEGARAASRRALDAAPQLPGALWNLAIAEEGQGNTQEAQRLLARLVAVNPDWEDAAFRLGYLQLQNGEYAPAANSFHLCLKKRNDWPQALLNWALASWKSNDLESAATGFHRVMLQDPNNSSAMSCLAAVLAEQKNSGEALYWYRKVAAQGQPVPELSYNVGLLLQSIGDHATAAECYRAAIRGKPDFSQALLNLGHVLKAAGREDEARQLWSKALAANPGLVGERF